MLLSEVSNEPAGRLRQVLATVRAVPNKGTLSNLWEIAAPLLSPIDPDPLSVRAEAGVLYRAVELAIAALPTESEREAYRSYRFQWARPIYGLGIQDIGQHAMTGDALIGDEALRTLAMLSGTLAHTTPEPRPRLSDQELQDRLGKIHETLLQMRTELAGTSWFDRRAKGRLLDLVNDAIDSVVYVRLRGFGTLEGRALAVEGELIASKAHLASHPDSVPTAIQEDRLDRVARWVSSAGQIVRDVRVLIEYDCVPIALGVSVGVNSGEVVAGLTAWIAGRVALEGVRAAPQLGRPPATPLPQGSQPTTVIESPQDSPDDGEGEEAAS